MREDGDWRHYRPVAALSVKAKQVQLTGNYFSFEKLFLLHIEIKSLCSFPDQIQMLPLSGHT
jgi:hypothetical protein